MPLENADFRSLRKLLSPLLRDKTQREYWLNEAFSPDQRLINQFTLDNLDPDAFTQKLIMHLYNEVSPAKLAEFIQVIQDEHGGDLSQALQMYVEKLKAPAPAPQPPPPNVQSQPPTAAPTATASAMPTMQPFPQFTPQAAPTFQLVGNYQVSVSFPYPNTHLMAMYGQQSFNAMGQFTASLNTTNGGMQMRGTWQMMGAQILLASTWWYTMMPMQSWYQQTSLQITGTGPAGFTTMSGNGEMVVFQRIG